MRNDALLIADTRCRLVSELRSSALAIDDFLDFRLSLKRLVDFHVNVTSIGLNLGPVVGAVDHLAGH